MICDTCKEAGRKRQDLLSPLTEHQYEELSRLHAECVGYNEPTQCNCAHRIRKGPYIA